MLPFRPVAGGALVGAVCLVEDDMPGYEAAAGLAPWIKGLYVDQPARRQGYGALLMSRVARDGPLPWDTRRCTCIQSAVRQRSSSTGVWGGRSCATTTTTASPRRLCASTLIRARALRIELWRRVRWSCGCPGRWSCRTRCVATARGRKLLLPGHALPVLSHP
jgi:hypothetical protein